MTHPRTIDEGSDDGSSLLEILVVLAILGIALAMAASTVRTSRSPSIKVMGSQVIGMLSAARLRAISRAEATALEIDLATRSFRLGGEKTGLVLPEGFEITATIGKETVQSKALGAIIFSGDGTSTGGEIILQDERSRRMTIVTDWLTGISTEIDNEK